MGAQSMREDEAAPSRGRMLNNVTWSGQLQNLHMHLRALESRHGAAKPAAVNKEFTHKTTSGFC